MSIVQPSYDRARLTPGIVHVGLGNFHRAHMATYLDDLFGLGEGHDWAILGAGVRPADARMREALESQDFLSTVIELDPGGKRARRVGAMIDFAKIDPTNGPLISAMSRPGVRIVSLTVTEGGYFIDPSTGRFDPSAAEIVADSATPDRPRSVFGAMVAALRGRRDSGLAPFTIMSCDNLPGNGHAARDAVVGLARLSDPDLGDWIDAHVAFPNAMVDRITPSTGPREREIAAKFGLGDDPVPVTCEPFRQWVMEDSFSAGRPALEKVGVTFTPEVHKFETMKIRILNGGHAIIGYPAELLGIKYVHEAIADRSIADFVDRVQTDEIIPIVSSPPGQDLGAYQKLVLKRFANQEIADTGRRLAFDGSNRQPKFIVPSIRDNIMRGIMPKGLILASALWCRYCFGVDPNGQVISPNDPNWAILNAKARAAKQDPSQWIGMRSIYGDLAEHAHVMSAFAEALDLVWTAGVRPAIAQYIDR